MLNKEEIIKLFKGMDLNSDGKIDLNEIKITVKNLCRQMINDLQSEKDAGNERKEICMENLDIKKYLEGNVMPLILEGMEELARRKPENPIEFLAEYILENNPEKLEKTEL